MFIPSVTTLGVISGVGELVWGVDVTGFSSTPSSDTSLNSWMLMLCVILFEHFELLHKSNHFVSLSNQCQQMSALNPESNAGEGGRAQYRKWIRKTKQNNNWVPLAKHYGQWACTQSWTVDILYFVHLQLSLSKGPFLYHCNSKQKPYQSMKSSEAPPPRPHRSSNLFRWILFKSFQLFPLFYILKKVLKICNRSTIQGRAKKDVWGAHEKKLLWSNHHQKSNGGGDVPSSPPTLYAYKIKLQVTFGPREDHSQERGRLYKCPAQHLMSHQRKSLDPSPRWSILHFCSTI